MNKLLSKSLRYIKTYGDLTYGERPRTPSAAIDYCENRPFMMAQVRWEIQGLGNVVQEIAPKRILEIGTNYGGTLFLWCSLAPPGAQIISVDLPFGEFGGGYPWRKIPLYRKFPRDGQELKLIRADSHREETKERVRNILGGEKLDYLFIDGDHTYEGVKRDFEMYSPLVRSGGVIAFHDVAEHRRELACGVDRYWNEVKQNYRHTEWIENPNQGWAGIGALYLP
jgi:predicted O-methyltransferase YrrM